MKPRYHFSGEHIWSLKSWDKCSKLLRIGNRCPDNNLDV